MTLLQRIARWRDADPRWFQIGFLTALLAVVLIRGSFTLSPPAMAMIVTTALVTQLGFVRALAIPTPGLLSPAISSLSLCLLLRADGVAIPALAAFLAIAGKFVLRVRGKHVFNPTNFGLLVAVLVTDRAWVSPGQWGSTVVAGFLFAALGLLVVRKIGRLDITLAFLIAHASLLVGRYYYLGEPSGIVGHRLLNGALIVFAFFMISDPRSTPDSRAGRILFAALVAVVGYVIQYHYFIPSGPLWALLAVSPVTPVIDRIWSGRRFTWTRGVVDETSSSVAA